MFKEADWALDKVVATLAVLLGTDNHLNFFTARAREVILQVWQRRRQLQILRPQRQISLLPKSKFYSRSVSTTSS